MKRGTLTLEELAELTGKQEKYLRHSIGIMPKGPKTYVPGPTPPGIALTGQEVRCIARVLNSNYPDTTLGMARGEWWKEGEKDGVENLQYFGHKLIALGILDPDA